MGNWGEESDYEAKSIKDYNGRFTINFKKIFIFFLLSYQVFALVMIPFLAFYIIALFRVYKCWKSFNYSSLTFWGMSIAGICVAFALAQLLQHVIGNII